MNSVINAKPAPAQILSKALAAAGEALGLSQSELAEAIGRDRSSIYRKGINPHSKPGEAALLVIRVYRALFALVGGDVAQMRHWMHTANRHTRGVPAEQLRSTEGLVDLVHYLDALRGKL
ncbi:MAG: MbcA/ParS/Xre antitoxin family protein [Methylotetracoccus sp.]